MTCHILKSVLVAILLALLTVLDDRVVGSSPAGGKILSKPKPCLIASRALHKQLTDMTEILQKDVKLPTHPSIVGVEGCEYFLCLFVNICVPVSFFGPSFVFKFCRKFVLSLVRP